MGHVHLQYAQRLQFQFLGTWNQTTLFTYIIQRHCIFQYYIYGLWGLYHGTHQYLKAKMFALGEWYSCRGLAVVVNSGVSTLGYKLLILTLSVRMGVVYGVLGEL